MEPDQQVLFGSLPGPVEWFSMIITRPTHDSRGRVAIQSKAEMRQQLMTLTFDNLEADRMATAVGYAVPLALKASYLSVDTWRRHAWALYRRVSVAGWEATIKGCGKG